MKNKMEIINAGAISTLRRSTCKHTGLPDMWQHSCVWLWDCKPKFSMFKETRHFSRVLFSLQRYSHNTFFFFLWQLGKSLKEKGEVYDRNGDKALTTCVWLTLFQPFKLTSTYIYGLDCIIYEACRKCREDKVT